MTEKKIFINVLIMLIFLFSFKVFSQENNYQYKYIQKSVIDSILKTENYKQGDTIPLKAIFKVNDKGLINILKVEAPNKILENEIVGILLEKEPLSEKYYNGDYEFNIKYIVEYSKVKYYLFNKENSDLPEDHIWSLVIDKNGNKWIGTGKKGLVKLNNNEWKIFNKENSIIKGSYISPMYCDNSNNLWLTYSRPDTFIKFDGKKWETLPSNITKLKKSPIKIVEDSKGNLYVGGFNELVKYNGQKWTKIHLPKGNFTIRAIAVDTDGTIAIGHNNGLLIFNNGNWKSFNISKEENKLQNYVRSLKYLKEGKLFIGYGGNLDGGFSILENNEWKHFNKSNSNLSNNMVRDVEVDNNGSLWLATNNGLNKVDINGEITPIFFKEAGRVTVITDIAVDGNIIWVGTNFGLIKIYQ